ncbi:UDP-2,4-diacetamido-2,4,6-trideoxy-beta-L-altropyranose hydrolase [Niveibacterium umoris]|uniref:UDP-2,4-diacetamido-2,4, 6-trideoxy-beta-L-altropyranose hydrolase n=1 Tax=Niveibacterium umoris TaxID=1193620 RepID=A0A840BGX6_9RHOO|nr:UDP-2,4-diacetamido-2,4,6-trideoxy-beta-L-altropyranose hydrolase [Niveibacterium umoris]MBB4011913.1 UDP-2,4-diacetamido-2,4,6-trideoxy-beta-L-altropyranose hydrolase [Niveibacterium umoris]
MRVVFRADASTRIGHGHVMRCLALATALARRGASCRFVCATEGDGAAAAIRAAGFDLRVLPSYVTSPAEDAQATLAMLAGAALPDWIIVDHYRLDARWEVAVQAGGCRVMAIDDLADRRHHCDMFLDQNWHDAPHHRYAGLLPAGCLACFGPGWALLRPEFAAMSPRERDGSVRRVLICFGGGDASDATARVLKTLQPLTRLYAFEVVVGAGYPHLDALTERCKALPGVTLSVAVSDMAARMRAADLFIGAAGSMTWERACVGLPGITIAIADNQRELGRRLAVAGEGVDLGDFGDEALGRLPAAFRKLVSDRQGLRQMSAALRLRCDGRGAERVAERLYGFRDN